MHRSRSRLISAVTYAARPNVWPAYDLLSPVSRALPFSSTGVCARADLPYSTTDFTWHDASRNRDVPARIYAPTSGGPYPVIIFSHGLGGSDKGYSYLGEYWAAHGYISVHVQHIGSDSAVLWPPGNMQRAMKNVDNYINRPKDISFAIDQVTALNAAPGPWHGRFDLNWIGVAGHSFGAYTTMAIAGRESRLARRASRESWAIRA